MVMTFIGKKIALYIIIIKENYMTKTIKDFLRQYAEKFPEKIYKGEVDKFLNETNEITFDYADGLITFFHYKRESSELSTEERYYVTAEGGNNGYMINEPEYQFIWAALLEREPKFMEFMSDHDFAHDDLMTLIVSWRNCEEEIGKQEIEVRFNFYEWLEEDK